MTVNYYNELPAGILKIEPRTREWRYPIASAIALQSIDDTVTDDDGSVESILRFEPRHVLQWDTKLDYFGIPVEPGLTVLTAPTGVGKTQAAIMWADDLQQRGISTGWITLNEPARFSDFMNTEQDVANALSELEILPHVIFIDSFRLLQFSVSGTTRAGGVSSGLFEMLTELNNAAEASGVMIVGIFNPLAADETTAERFDSELSSSVHQLVRLTSPTTGTFTSRALDRKHRNFSTTGSTGKPTKDGLLGVEVVASSTPSPFNIANRIFGE